MAGKYVDPFSDFGFKKIFGEEPHKQLLIDFLNQVLQDKESSISDITYLPQEDLGEQVEERTSYFDLVCETDKDKFILVEMQRGHQTHFLERLLYYASKLISRQGKKGKDWKYQLRKVYVISLADFPIVEYQGCPEFSQDLILQNPKYRNISFDFLTIRTIETKKFTKTREELKTRYDTWLYYLTHMTGEASEKDLQGLPKDSAFERLLEVASVLNLKESEFRRYEAELDRRNDEYSRLVSAIEIAEKKGEARGETRGVAKGKVEGRKEEQLKIAKNLLAKGLDAKTVSEATGISKKDLAKL